MKKVLLFGLILWLFVAFTQVATASEQTEKEYLTVQIIETNDWDDILMEKLNNLLDWFFWKNHEFDSVYD